MAADPGCASRRPKSGNTPAAAAAAAAEAARLEALAPPSVVYLPPDTTPPRPEGIPAVAPTLRARSRGARPAAALGRLGRGGPRRGRPRPHRPAQRRPGAGSRGRARRVGRSPLQRQTPETGPAARLGDAASLAGCVRAWSRSRRQRLRSAGIAPSAPDRRIPAEIRERRLSRHRATSGAAAARTCQAEQALRGATAHRGLCAGRCAVAAALLYVVQRGGF